ncbi:MAG: hypothetical protein ACXWPK_00195 [Isosphaeraceae bacterium]
MNVTVARLRELEARFERLIVDHQALKTQVAALNNQLQAQQSQDGKGKGGVTVYSMVGVVIAAGGSITGATVNALVGGSTQMVTNSAKVYNQMQAATVVTNTIMLGANPDGTYSAISQSC